MMHRHDIRVGIASSMCLKHFVPDRARRIEMMAMLYPAYWRWSACVIVIAMQEHQKELAAPGADASRRADIYAAAWASVEAKFVNSQVVGFRDERRVALLPRCEATRLTGGSKGRFGYHTFSNPASRRTGAAEASQLLQDMRDGNLESACKALDQEWAASGASYKRSQEVLAKHDICTWRRATYSRIRFTAS